MHKMISTVLCCVSIPPIRFQYFLIVFIVFVTMLVGGVLGYVFRENVRKHTDYKMRSTLADYSSKPSIRQAWDETQESVSLNELLVFFVSKIPCC